MHIVLGGTGRVGDPDALRGVFRTGRRAYLLNPPADPATDTDARSGARRSLRRAPREG